MPGFRVQDAKNIVRLIGGASTLAISLAEYWNTDKRSYASLYIDEVVPASVALTLTAYMGLGMFVMALILLVARGDFSWRKEAAKSQVYASALAFLASAFLVGLKTKHTDSLGDVLGDLPGGMFLCLSLVTLFEWVFDVVQLSLVSDALYQGIGENFENTPLSKRMAEREQMSMVGFISVAFAITLSAISHWHYECKLELQGSTGALKLGLQGSVGNYTCDYDKSPVSVGAMTSYGVIATIAAACVAFVVQGFVLGFIFPVVDGNNESSQTRFRWHAGFGVTIALVLYSSAAALAMSVGRDFSKQFYLEGFLASNFLYYAAILFAFLGVVQFQDFDGVHEKFRPAVQFRKLGTVAQLAGAMLLGAFCTAALWGSDLLYNKEIAGGGGRRGPREGGAGSLRHPHGARSCRAHSARKNGGGSAAPRVQDLRLLPRRQGGGVSGGCQAHRGDGEPSTRVRRVFRAQQIGALAYPSVPSRRRRPLYRVLAALRARDGGRQAVHRGTPVCTFLGYFYQQSCGGDKRGRGEIKGYCVRHHRAHLLAHFRLGLRVPRRRARASRQRGAPDVGIYHVDSTYGPRPADCTELGVCPLHVQGGK